MKQNIIMIAILVALFFFGLLIYDFSDELDKSISSRSWYAVMEGELARVSFSNHNFVFVNPETDERIPHFSDCVTYRFNRNINVIRLNCNVKGNKIHLSNITDDSITLTLDGDEVDFFILEEEAWNADFRNRNNLTLEEFNSIISFDFNKYTEVRASDVEAITRGDDRYVAFVNNSQTFKNALNVEALRNFANNSSIPVVVIIIDDLTNEDLARLRRLNREIHSNVEDFDLDTILLYKAGDRKLTFIDEIDVYDFSEAESYNIN